MNKALHQAKKAKSDEFYTQLSDIEKELKHYKDHFKGKTVLCNCDDPRISNFFRYFVLKFKDLGLKELITTCYKNQNADLFSTRNSEKAVFLRITPPLIESISQKNNGIISIENFPNIPTIPLEGDGDFRSAECVEFLKEADIVVTNPPFSLFREYVAQLVKHNKKFLIIGNINAITYKEIFPLIRDNRIWIGPSIHSGDREFGVPDHYPLKAAGFRIDESGNKFIRVKGVRWFTNLDHRKRHEPLILYKKYTPEEYPKYDNYDAIEVSKVSEIPKDYFGVMGVPITFLDKYCPEQFEIVSFRKGKDGKDLVFTREREREYNRTSESLCNLDPGADKKCGRKSQRPNQIRQNHDSTLEPIDIDFPLATNLKNGLMNDCTIKGKKTYVRMLIQPKRNK